MTINIGCNVSGAGNGILMTLSTGVGQMILAQDGGHGIVMDAGGHGLSGLKRIRRGMKRGIISHMRRVISFGMTSHVMIEAWGASFKKPSWGHLQPYIQ